MKKPPAWAFTFCVNLEGWEARIRQIDRGIADGFYQVNGDVISLPNVDGSTTEVTRAALDIWRKRVARLVAETEKRIEANDREWVFWLSEYARMKVETFTENFDELYTPAIEAHGKRVRQLLRMRKDAAEANTKILDEDYDRVAPSCRSDKEIARALGVHATTLSRYKKRRGIS